MTARTFDRATYLRAMAAWDDGEYGSRWNVIRRIAAERGYLFPPHGTVHDDRDADPPSQRAIIYRALIDNPTYVEGIVRRAGSWSQVVDGIIGLEARLAVESNDREQDDAWNRKDETGPKEASMALKVILNRIGDS